MIVKQRLAGQGLISAGIAFRFRLGVRSGPGRGVSHPLHWLCVLGTMLVGAGSLGARDFAQLDAQLRAYERSHGAIAFVVLRAPAAEIVYQYRSPRLKAEIFPPGSLAKAWSAPVLLKHRSRFRFDPGRRYRCTGRFYPAQYFELNRDDRQLLHLRRDENGREYLQCSRPQGHGQVGLSGALAQSCNAYFLAAVAREPRAFYRILQTELSPAGDMRGPFGDLMQWRMTDVRDLSPFLAAAAAIGEGGSIRLSPLKAAQLFLALNHGGRLPVLRESGRVDEVFRASRRAGPPARLAFGSGDLRMLQFGLGRVAVDGTLAGFRTELDSLSRGRLRIRAAKTGSATPHRRRYGTHGWLALDFRVGQREFILLSFVERGAGGREARELTRAALTVLEPLL